MTWLKLIAWIQDALQLGLALDGSYRWMVAWIDDGLLGLSDWIKQLLELMIAYWDRLLD